MHGDARQRSVPRACRIGLIASGTAIGLWIAEQTTDQLIFEFLAIPFKITLLAALLFLVSDLSQLLYGRPKRALILGLVLLTVTLAVFAAYLPWRDVFARHFSNGVYRWYYPNMPAEHPGAYGDFAEWEQQWARRIPHGIEAGIIVLFYGFLVSACSIRRWSRAGGVLIALAGYGLLLFVPIWTGLIVWDYDTFLKGIALDSISMSLFPPYCWYPADYCIFLYVFLLITYGVCAVCFRMELKRSELTKGEVGIS